ncbi:MAG: DUF4476 domain-containing protein [Bacteroidia bacterium]|nr:DUF4476 domain-containing protein [Bacteroidia bacterium]
MSRFIWIRWILIPIFSLSVHFVFGQMYVAVLSKGNAGYRQVYSIQDRFPEDKIKEYQQNGYFVDDISYGSDIWTITASDRKDYYNQIVITSEDFPQETLDSKAKEGYFISDLTYGKSQGVRVWGVVLVQGAAAESQIVLSGESFPFDEVYDQLLNDYRITDIAVGKEGVKVVMIKGRKMKMVSQDIIVTEEFPGEFIEQKTKSENPSVITHISYQDNKWYVVLGFGSEHNSQYYTVQKAMPSNTIQQGWEEGYIVTQFQKFVYRNERISSSIPAYLTDYTGRIRCNDIMTDRTFNKISNGVSNITVSGLEGDQMKLKIINDWMYKESICMCTEQIAKLINVFEYDDSRYDFLEMMYSRVYDIDNYTFFEEALGDDSEVKKKFKKLLKSEK